jgi:hypothetical protein
LVEVTTVRGASPGGAAGVEVLPAPHPERARVASATRAVPERRNGMGAGLPTKVLITVVGSL